MAQLSYKTRVLNSAEERKEFINRVKQLNRPIVEYPVDKFANHQFGNGFNSYVHISYCHFLSEEIDSPDLGKPTYCKIILGNEPTTIYIEPLVEDEFYEITDQIKKESNDRILLDCAKKLRGILRKVERKFQVKLTYDKETAHKLYPEIKVPSVYKNPLYDGCTVDHVYGYDLNSAYSYYILKFGLNWCTIKNEDYKGKETEINNLVNKEFADFINYWFLLKKNSVPGSTERDKAKQMLNVITGHIRNINPEAYKELKWGVQTKIIDKIINECDQPIVYSNVDSIYTIGRCSVLDKLLGADIGQFKLEHGDCSFTWQLGKINYQIDDQYPVMRGVPKYVFKLFFLKFGRPFKLNVDKVPKVKYYSTWDLREENNND